MNHLDDRCGADRFEWEAEVGGAIDQGPVAMRIDHAVPGPVRVTGWDRPAVAVSARKHVRGAHGAEAERLMQETEIEVTVHGSEVQVTTDAPRSWFGWSSSQVRVELMVRVPRGSAVNIDGSSGSVTVDGTEGPVSVDAGSGGVQVSLAAGPVSVDAGSGSVTVSEVRGDVNLEVGSGPVVVRRVKGDVEVNGSSGSIRASEVEGRLNADTASGSVILDRIIGDISVDTGSGGVRLEAVNSRFVNVDTGSGGIDADFEVHSKGRYHFDTGSGSIVLTVPDDASFTLEAETGSGGVSCRLPLTMTHSTRHRLEGRLGDGSAHISADTSSGRLVVRGRRGYRSPDGGLSRESDAGSTGGPRPAASPVPDEHRQAVLRMVSEGKITAAQAAGLLRALGDPSAAVDGAVEAPASEPPADEPAGALEAEEAAGDLAEEPTDEPTDDPADDPARASAGHRGGDLMGI